MYNETAMNYINTNLTDAINAAKGLRNSTKEFQRAIGYIAQQVYQHGNADSIRQIFTAAGLLVNKNGTMYCTRQGLAVWAYLSDAVENGGLGMKSVVRFNNKESTFNMVDKWGDNTPDLALVVNNLAWKVWSHHNKVKAETAFDLDKILKLAFSKAQKNGINSDEFIAKARLVAKAV